MLRIDRGDISYSWCPCALVTLVLLKKPDILELIDEEEPDIIAGTETWLNTDISSSEFFPPSYQILRQDRIGSSHGGALLAIKSELSVERIDSPIQL